MKAINVGRGWVRALVAMALLWGVAVAAQAAPTQVRLVVTTDPLVGATHDTVVASVVDAVALRRGAPVPMTLRILDEHGAVLATVTGITSPAAPLWVSARAPSSAGVRAQLILPPEAEQVSAGVLAIEREGLGDPPPPPTKLVCEFPAKDPITTMPEPVTMGKCWVETVET
ncbi:hypothetical protein [Corallococcus exiguus]|uniref:hypothetical protein n=1 Tax=Corallococcus exiguus TaxID=83462 RepID=UPI00155FE7AC|nr:hypothetical protein [Corallococcus exiguus]NRD50606.1 hypothetical protein [Corallococcus exiguus]